RQPCALLPDQRADHGRRRRALRARRAAGPHNLGEGARAEPRRVPPARAVVPRLDLPAAVGDDAVRNLDPHLRRGLRARPGGAGRGRGQGRHAGALVDQPPRVALLAPGLGPLVWADLERGVGWANFFVIAASISLAHALVSSGAAPWLGRLLVGGLPALGDSALAVVVLLMLGATLLRAIVPNI